MNVARIRRAPYELCWSTGRKVEAVEGVSTITCDGDAASKPGGIEARSRQLVVLAVVCRTCGEGMAEVDQEGRQVQDDCVACQARKEARQWEPLDVGSAYWMLGGEQSTAERPALAAWAKSTVSAAVSLALACRRMALIGARLEVGR